MEITLNKKNTTEASIKISLQESDYQSRVEDKVKDYAKNAQIKGFRKGKVPISMIKNLYGKSILVEQVNDMISQGLTDYIKDNNLSLLGKPLPNRSQANEINWDTQKDFDFEYRIGLIDTFEVDLSTKRKIDKHEIKVDKEIIDETVSNLKEQHGEMTNPEISEEGDAIYCSFTQVESDLKSNGVIETKELDKKEAKQFIGLKKEDKLSFEPKKILPSDFQIAQVLGTDVKAVKNLIGKVEIEVIKINRTIPAKINQAFFDKIFGKDVVKDENKFLEKVEESISKSFLIETDNLFEKDIRNHLVSSIKMDTPNDFLKEWLLASNNEKFTDELFDSEFDTHISELKWTLIKNKIAENALIEVGQGDIKNKAIEVLTAQFGAQAIGQQIGDKMNDLADHYLKANNGENYSAIYKQVASEKVYAHIKDNITINIKKVSLDEFKKLAEK